MTLATFSSYAIMAATSPKMGSIQWTTLGRLDGSYDPQMVDQALKVKR